MQHYDAHDESVTSLSFHQSGSYLLTGSADAKVKVWDLVEGRLFYTLHSHEGAVHACEFSPAGDFFASAGADVQAIAAPFGENLTHHRPNTRRRPRIFHQYASPILLMLLPFPTFLAHSR